MGSKQRYLANAGAVDVAHLISAFEDVNECSITLIMAAVERHNTTDLHITCHAFTKPDAAADPVLLASHQFYRSGQNFLTLDSAIIYALYQLDARMEDERHPNKIA